LEVDLMKDRSEETRGAWGQGSRRLKAGEVEAVRAGLESTSHPLDSSERALMEARFGHDFGNVRIHDDAAAARSAEAVGTAAYTVGRDIVFAEGRYAPQTAPGRALLAHELAHVAQQRSASVVQVDHLEAGGTADTAERDAEHAALESFYPPLDPETRATPSYLGARASRADQQQALAEFSAGHPDGVLEQYRSRLSESPTKTVVRRLSPLQEVRLQGCARGEKREDLDKSLPGNDEMVRQIFRFFYPDLSQPGALNDDLRDLAARMLADAIRGSREMDYVPRPPAKPGIGWLFTEAIKMAWRKGMDEGIYVAVKNVVAAKYRSEFELAKEGIGGP
jgi:hypothetical protein